MTSNNTRDSLLTPILSRAGNNRTSGSGFGVLPVAYDTKTGDSAGGEASAAFGAVFASMALNLPIQISGNPDDEGGGGKGNNNIGAIVGGVLGVVAFIVLVLLAIFLWRRRVQRKFGVKEEGKEPRKTVVGIDVTPAPYDYPTDSVVPRTTKRELLEGADSSQPRDSTINSSGTSPTTATAPTSPTSPKRRNRGAVTQTQESESPTQPVSSSAGPISSSPANDSGAGGGADFRTEFEQLRREVQELRAQGVVGYEAPPQYENR